MLYSQLTCGGAGLSWGLLNYQNLDFLVILMREEILRMQRFLPVFLSDVSGRRLGVL